MHNPTELPQDPLRLVPSAPDTGGASPHEAAAHQKTEELLRRNEALFQLLIDSAQDYAIFVLDPEGHILTWNPGAERIKGYRAEEIIGKHFSSFYPREAIERGWPQYELQVAACEGRFEDEGWRLRKDGSRFWANVVITALRDRSGQLQGFSKITRDLTERKRLEEELRTANETLERRVAERTAEVEERNRRLRRLAAELAAAEQRERKRIALTLHDHFQQILVAAKFTIGQLLATLENAPAGAMAEQVGQLIDEAIQASRTLTVELSPPVLYDRGLAAALQWLERHDREKHGLELRLDLEKDAEPLSASMKAFLFQAIRELLFNVVKHARTREAWIRMRRDAQNQVEITVEDQGVGCEQVRLAMLKEAEVGFGLFNIQQRIDLLGGRFHVETAPGQGCRVTLSVPADIATPEDEPLKGPAEEAALPGVPADPNGPQRKIRVLIADDHRMVREGIAGLLQMYEDIEVIGQAENGRAAVELAHRLRPDAIVMDVSMPIMDGIDATRSILSKLPETRIIGLSMHERQDMTEAMLTAGAVAYLTKGGPPEALVQALRL